MLLLSVTGQTSTQIAQIVLRSQDTVVRVLKRFLAGGLDAVPRRTAPGRVRTVTAAWEAELVRIIELDPHEVREDTANWTTERLARYLASTWLFWSRRRPCATTYMPMITSASVRPGLCSARLKRS